MESSWELDIFLAVREDTVFHFIRVRQPVHERGLGLLLEARLLREANSSARTGLNRLPSSAIGRGAADRRRRQGRGSQQLTPTPGFCDWGEDRREEERHNARGAPPSCSRTMIFSFRATITSPDEARPTRGSVSLQRQAAKARSRLLEQDLDGLHEAGARAQVQLRRTIVCASHVRKAATLEAHARPAASRPRA